MRSDYAKRQRIRRNRTSVRQLESWQPGDGYVRRWLRVRTTNRGPVATALSVLLAPQPSARDLAASGRELAAQGNVRVGQTPNTGRMAIRAVVSQAPGSDNRVAQWEARHSEANGELKYEESQINAHLFALTLCQTDQAALGYNTVLVDGSYLRVCASGGFAFRTGEQTIAEGNHVVVEGQLRRLSSKDQRALEEASLLVNPEQTHVVTGSKAQPILLARLS